MKNIIIFTLVAMSILVLPNAYGDFKTFLVNSQTVECVGVGPMKCMQVREDPNSQWSNFYDKIEGFNFQEGFNYKITVEVTDIENPPADASSKKYKLIEVLEKISATKHVPFMNLCAPGFVPLGQSCVLNDSCGLGAHAGKICVVDNVIQPYLRPLQQGMAGIPASNVICAEGLKLIFKHDASPSCVKPDSVSKIVDRGWFMQKPPVACTKEYVPVCGMDGKTYGNKCNLEAEHMGLGHVGECIQLTEFSLDKQYNQIQSKISEISSQIYNGRYNGEFDLSEALAGLVDGKEKLKTLLDEYNSLDTDSKTDKQIGMRFSTLGRMGFASIDSQIKIIENQIGKSDLKEESKDPVIVAVGDIACANKSEYRKDPTRCHELQTSELALSVNPDAVFLLGDLQYYVGNYEDFLGSFDPTWGRLKSISYPAPGNHEYQSFDGAKGYFDYFGPKAGNPANGYYSFDIGSWHVVSLNSNCQENDPQDPNKYQIVSCAKPPEQIKWLKDDLASNDSKCTLAFWHHPMFSSGGGGNQPDVGPFWEELYADKADIVLVGHDHNYERFLPQAPNATQVEDGITEFVVGTGGWSLWDSYHKQENSVVFNATSYGILKLVLHDTSYDWEFISEPGSEFSDQGSAVCH